MTREEVKKQYQLAKTDVAPLIDKIFDYFENRSCERCKYLDKNTDKSYSRCELFGRNIGREEMMTFYCSEIKEK